jgi:hypothetical protein
VLLRSILPNIRSRMPQKISRGRFCAVLISPGTSYHHRSRNLSTITSARTGSSHSRNNLRGYEFRDVVLIAPTRAKVVAPVSSEGRSCVYVPITHNGKVVDSQRIHTRPGRRMSGGRCAALQGIELFSSVYGFAVVNMPSPRAKLIDQQPVARKPMQKPPLDPHVADTALSDSVLPAYD